MAFVREMGGRFYGRWLDQDGNRAERLLAHVRSLHEAQCVADEIEACATRMRAARAAEPSKTTTQVAALFRERKQA